MPYTQHMIPYSEPTTSYDAAISLDLTKAAADRQAVYDYVKAHGSATDEEIQSGLRMSGDTERPRRGELVKSGRLVYSGARSRTKQGRGAKVWVVA